MSEATPSTAALARTAARIARGAGRLLLKGFQASRPRPYHHRARKAYGVTYDLRADAFIISAIRKAYPRHTILTEESGFLNRGSPYTWTVDPLDGTTNFSLGNPFFAVSIAVAWKTDLLAGVIYAPALNALYMARKGAGATVNGRRVRVSTDRTLASSFVVFCEGNEKRAHQAIQLYRRLRPKVMDLRKLGSAAVECGWVAEGRAACYFVTQINPWDVAAGVLIVREAGGTVSDFQGKDWAGRVSSLVVSNGLVHQSILKLTKREDGDA